MGVVFLQIPVKSGNVLAVQYCVRVASVQLHCGAVLFYSQGVLINSAFYLKRVRDEAA